MNIKKKLILIGICAAIIVIVFTVNVIRRMKDNPEKEPGVIVKETIISRAEAYRLLSYLDYDRAERETLPLGIVYASTDMSGWYDTYVNAVWKMGLIEGDVTTTPKEALTYGACKALIDKLIMIKPAYQSIYTGLTFDFIKAEEEMSVVDFLELYEAVLATTPEEAKTIHKQTLFVLGREISEDGKDRMVTDLGKYYYLDAKGYESFYEIMKHNEDPTGVKPTEGMKANDSANENTTGDVANSSSDQIYENNGGDTAEALGDNLILSEAQRISTDRIATDYLDKGIEVFVCGQEIVYISSVTTEKIVLHNVWIKSGSELTVDTFISGINKSFAAKFRLSNEIEKVVGDIAIEDQKVVQISVKPDMIQGKVLQTGDDFIEIEGYGKVPLDESYRIYKIYGELSQEPTGSILVGYEATDFVVSGGKISAALITEVIKAENIRVLLKTTDFSSVYHNKVEFTSETDFIVSNKEKETPYKAGEIVTIEPGNELLKEGRLTVKTSSDQGKIQILSLVRSSKNPKYRGSIEISEDEKGLLIVNDLPMEEYLYAVIPSEMPTYYGIEPLKVQAVCARSYAYKHLMANSLSMYGAHVDDSVSYQVYNNIAENEDSILAVKDTYGKVIEYKGDVITAYYFSTSCGHTTSVQYVWSNGEPTPYLKGKLMALVEEGDASEEQLDAISTYQDLSVEETFRNFINEKGFITYDSAFDWYRWKVSMKPADIKKVIDSNLKKRYNANPDLILTMTQKAKEGKEAVYESQPLDTLGDIMDVKVLKREVGGIISELLITGTEKTIKVKTEYNIRALLAPTYSTLIRQDESEINDLGLLPSAFFFVERKEKDGKLSGITLNGGGYGHGVGMSQNGVKALADTGKEYEEIIPYFYEGTKMGFIYE
ncbi:MAG: putative rane protein [Herbinix sp.]|jgi:stage II sporulation protein D|nr:putative rane protein [Herbinix sp.]